jgi:hypothetical protein
MENFNFLVKLECGWIQFSSNSIINKLAQTPLFAPSSLQIYPWIMKAQGMVISCTQKQKTNSLALSLRENYTD